MLKFVNVNGDNGDRGYSRETMKKQQFWNISGKIEYSK